MNALRFVASKLVPVVDSELLAEFAEKFNDEWVALTGECPNRSMDSKQREELWKKMLRNDKDPPQEMMAALLGIQKMARPKLLSQLRQWILEKAANPEMPKEISLEDAALKFWLVDRTEFENKEALDRVKTLIAFTYFVKGKNSFAQANQVREDAWEKLTEALDDWYGDHWRGKDMVVAQEFPQSSDRCFVIRHGEAYARVRTVKGRHLEIQCYRPAKDDLVIYNVKRDELRVNARTYKEEECYREQFGIYLKGSKDYFVREKVYDLAPLLEDFDRKLPSHEHVKGIEGEVLKEVEIEEDGPYGLAVTFKGPDVHQALGPRTLRPYGNGAARVVRAVFELKRESGYKPMRVEVRPPADLKVGVGGDVGLAQQWLAKRKMRVATRAD